MPPTGAISSAPLVLSFDLNDTALLDKLWPTIASPEVLAINSATAGGHPGTLISQSSLPCSSECAFKHERLKTRWQLWAKPLGAGRGLAVLALNFDGAQSVRVPISLAQFPAQWWGGDYAASGLPPASATVRDVWAMEAAGNASSSSPWQSALLAPRDCQLLILKPIKA